MAQLHVVFGGGQVGSGVARLLVARGFRVRVVRRRSVDMGQGIEVVAGDARDAAFARVSAAGASVVYHCMNPSMYTAKAWEAEFPALGEAVIGAALAADARLVCLDNLYGYGAVDGRRDEATPLAATGPKGRVRIAWDARLRGAVGLRFVVGRAGDFFGPGAEQALLSEAVLTGIAKGTRPWVIGDADAAHAFSYVPDVVAALVALGTAAPDVERQVFHLPVVEISPRELVAHFGRAHGRVVAPRVLPAWVVRLMGPFPGLLGELGETLYQWDRPFLVDDQRFRARFPGLATPLDRLAA